MSNWQSSDHPPSSNQRPLGATEQALWLRDRTMPLHFVLTAQISGLLHPEKLTAVLALLQQRHPLLRVKIALDDQDHPWFVGHSAPIPCQTVQRQGEDHWQQEVARQLTQPFDWAEAPLIRIMLLHSPEVSELIMVYHHAIADGMAAAGLIREMLTFLTQSDNQSDNQPDNDSDSEAVAIIARPLPLPLEVRLPNYRSASLVQRLLGQGVLQLQQFSRKFFQIYSRLYYQIYHQVFNQTPKPTTPHSSPPPSLGLQIHADTLSAEVTDNLMQRCHQEETTVHAAICTAFLFATAIKQQVPKQTLTCLSPINLRPYLQVDAELDCAVYVAPGYTTHPLTPDSLFWQVARSLKASLLEQVKATHLLKLAQSHEVLMQIKPSPETIHQVFIERCGSDVMVTNLGRLGFPQAFGHLKLQAIYGPMVCSGFAEERVVGVATLQDRLSLTLVQSLSSGSSAGELEDGIQLLQQAIALPDFSLATASARNTSVQDTSVQGMSSSR